MSLTLSSNVVWFANWTRRSPRRGEFVIEARLAAQEGIPAGEHLVQATLRYQACNESVCFAPARATAKWTITVRGEN